MGHSELLHRLVLNFVFDAQDGTDFISVEYERFVEMTNTMASLKTNACYLEKPL